MRDKGKSKSSDTRAPVSDASNCSNSRSASSEKKQLHKRSFPTDRKISKRGRVTRKAASSMDRSSPSEIESDPEVGPDEFLVKLDMTGKSGLGIEVDWANGKSLLIKSVKSQGAVPYWNRNHPPDQSVQAEDHVISVNKKAGDPKAMLVECRTKSRLNLVVWAHNVRSAEHEHHRRPSFGRTKAFRESRVERKSRETDPGQTDSNAKSLRARSSREDLFVSLDMKDFNVLGLDVLWADGKTLYIKSIVSGAVEDWNQTQKSDKIVNCGDSIAAVNGYGDDARGMAGLCLELCETHSPIQLRIRRVPPAPPTPPPTHMID